jgi:hypothetical protein
VSFWGDPRHAMLLVELIQTGEVRRRRAQEAAWSALLELGWARRTRRQGVLALDEKARRTAEETLRHAWPDWADVVGRLGAGGLPPTPAGFAHLERRDRVDAAGRLALPTRMNRRTAAATVGRHAKARLGPFEQVVLEDVDVTDDGLVRMRPSAGLQVRKGGVVQDARNLASLLGELVLVDRALRDGTRLVGKKPRAVLTVENLGAYQDALVSDDVLVVHVPGWNTRTTRDLLKGLDEVPVVHFGDLDPNGIAILSHLRRWRPRVRWLVPSYWEERRDDKGLTRDWPNLDMPQDAPDWVRRLPERRTWLEQEVVAVDSRFRQFLEMEIRRALSK